MTRETGGAPREQAMDRILRCRPGTECHAVVQGDEELEERRVTLVDRIAQVARTIGANEQAFSLSTLYGAYVQQFPHEKRGHSLARFAATLYSHCINMR